MKDVEITNSTIFKPEDFRPIYQPFLDKKVTFKDLDLIVARIKSKYKEKGFLTSTAYFPEQDIKDGKARLVDSDTPSDEKVVKATVLGGSLKYYAVNDKLVPIYVLESRIETINNNIGTGYLFLEAVDNNDR